MHISPLSPDPRILFELISSIYIVSKVKIEINMITACKCDLLSVYRAICCEAYVYLEGQDMFIEKGLSLMEILGIN